jgi:hypothetical protein
MYRIVLYTLFCLLPSLNSPEKVALKNLEGKTVQLNFKEALCESYSLNIRTLIQQYRLKDFNFVAIIPGKSYSKESVIAFRNKYQLNQLLFWFDPNYELCDAVGATITPEVFVFLPHGKKVYNGRIDNWAYELGKKRKVITEHDLKNVLNTISKNLDIIPFQTKAVGCFIR